MICDWLVNRECLLPEESSIKIDVLGLDTRRDPISILKTRELKPLQ